MPVPVSVAALQDAAVAVSDSMDNAGGRLDVEAAAGPHRDPAGMGARPFAGGHFGAHQVAGLEPEVAFGPGAMPARESVAVQARALFRARHQRFLPAIQHEYCQVQTP